MLYARPDLMHRVLALNADTVAAYLNAQIEAGAQAVMIFDSWGGVLAHREFLDFSLAYTQRVLRQIKREHEGRRVPSIVFTKGGGLWLEAMADTGADVLGVDWTVDLADARRRVGRRVALQGNLDPNVLFAPPEVVAAQAEFTLERFGPPRDADGRWAGHIFNLGHGISQYTPPDSVAALVETVHSRSRSMRVAH
jgi:uroporphyrinogen decarboxylase